MVRSPPAVAANTAWCTATRATMRTPAIAVFADTEPHLVSQPATPTTLPTTAAAAATVAYAATIPTRSLTRIAVRHNTHVVVVNAAPAATDEGRTGNCATNGMHAPVPAANTVTATERVRARHRARGGSRRSRVLSEGSTAGVSCGFRREGHRHAPATAPQPGPGDTTATSTHRYRACRTVASRGFPRRATEG